MRRFRAIAIAVIAFAAAAPARSQAPIVSEILGTVTNATRPVANALVIALNLQDLKATEAWTATDGHFSLPALRTGIYKIIAVKQGFVPAITTIVPTKPSHKVTLRLDAERAVRKSTNQEIWQLRGSLPADVLRDLDFALQTAEIDTYEIPRFRGEMLSLTGVSKTPANPAYAQTSLGVQGRIGESWQVGIRGNMQRFEDPTDEVRFGGTPVAESSVMSMEVRSSPTQSYKIASTMSKFLYAESPNGEQQADVRAHNFEWQNGPARVQVRYFAQDNLFRNAAPDGSRGSNLIEIGGNVPVLQTQHNGLDVALRVTQESVATTAQTLRMADVSANGTIAVIPSVILHYGVASRIGLEGQELAPRAGAEWKLGESTSLIGSMMVKALDRDATTVILPSLVFWSEESKMLPKYAYTLGFISGKDGKNRFSAIATITAVDEPLRVVFADGENQFWDGLYVDAGDIRRDVRIAYSRQFGNRFAIDLATSAGTATPALQDREKVYVTGDLQSTFTPTRTTIGVSYRDIQQPGEEGEHDYRSERLHVSMAQSLYLPVDLKLLLGLELARAENSPYLIETLNSDGRSRKYIGGLALNF
jgi:carboxypeptidase family protein